MKIDKDIFIYFDLLKSKWKSFICFIKYHFTKDNWNIIKTVLCSYPWDAAYLYELEQAKLKEMINYQKKSQLVEGWERSVRYMQICVNLLDIITEKIETSHITGNLDFLQLENSDQYEISKNKLEYHCDVKVNLNNISRFVSDIKLYPFYKKFPDEFYKLKAKKLYHKIRYEEDCGWWD